MNFTKPSKKYTKTKKQTMLENNLMLLLGATILFTAINGFLLLGLSKRIDKLEEGNYTKDDAEDLIAKKTVEIYAAMEKTMLDTSVSHNEKLSSLIDVVCVQLNSMDQRVEEFLKSNNTKKASTRKPKAAKDVLLKS